MAKQITLGVEENGISFTFDESNHYLYGDGKIVCPKNSLILVTDESEMFTLKKANGDVFLSARYDAVEGISSKEDLVDWFIENAVSTGGGGGIDPETLAELVSSAEYVSSSHTINFENVSGDVISTIDASDFIKDGMLDSVQVSGTNLVFVFNTDSGKEDISIPLSSFFDPTLYYTKTEVDTALSGKADVSAVTAIADSLSGKQDTLLFYTEDDNTQDGIKDAKIETTIEDSESGIVKTAYVESFVNDSSPYSEIYASTDVDNGEESYMKSADVYADSEDGVFINYHTHGNIEQTTYDAQININADGIALNVDNGEDVVSFNVTADGVDIDGDAVVTESMLDDYATVASLSGKADVSAVTAVSDALATKQDTLVAGSGITISGNVISADGGSSDPNKLDVTAFTAYSAATATAISGKVDTVDYDEAQRVTATALNDLNDRKQDTLVAGSGITISGNVISAEGGGGSITIDQTLDTGSTNAVANSAITDALNNVYARADYIAGIPRYYLIKGYGYNKGSIYLYNPKINGRAILSTSSSENYNYSLVETSAITSAMTSGSTDSQVPSAKAVYDTLGGLKFVKCSQAEYDALTTKDPMTIYFITNVVNNNA